MDYQKKVERVKKLANKLLKISRELGWDIHLGCYGTEENQMFITKIITFSDRAVKTEPCFKTEEIASRIYIYGKGEEEYEYSICDYSGGTKKWEVECVDFERMIKEREAFRKGNDHEV